MTYRLRITPQARRELDEAFAWIARRSPARARAWQAGALRAVHALAELPRRCPLAPENSESDAEIRQFMYGEYRVLFTIDGELVRVLHVRHGARRPLPPDDI